MKRQFQELPGWTFEVHERSAGVFVVSGRDATGRNVERIGDDVDALLASCGLWARQWLPAAKSPGDLGPKRSPDEQ